ncbi:glycosyltransferase [Methanoculleus sp. FWC-SCC1]|uniref:Glycosyltransferase n=1 Tax=Methanoculleus frigidifontis TaxID=2584085 RepID=A0ABT8MBM9_9EURY|nr:glycosyltransferase [Methanoculleus sp. FWC-SCC1]MDN7025347.1 glycosyltransferase [Methanoculleus sp. FWC-SCC1]
MQYDSSCASATTEAEGGEFRVRAAALPASLPVYRYAGKTADLPRDIGTSSGEGLYRDHRIAVVVPAYNEEPLVGETLRTIPEYVSRFYVITDCSTDGTGDRIEVPVRRDPRIVHFRHDRNSGVGARILFTLRRHV